MRPVIVPCRHCGRFVTRASDGWVHVDGRTDCLDEWYLAAIGTAAEPASPG